MISTQYGLLKLNPFLSKKNDCSHYEGGDIFAQLKFTIKARLVKLSTSVTLPMLKWFA